MPAGQAEAAPPLDVSADLQKPGEQKVIRQTALQHPLQE